MPAHRFCCKTCRHASVSQPPSQFPKHPTRRRPAGGYGAWKVQCISSPPTRLAAVPWWGAVEHSKHSWHTNTKENAKRITPSEHCRDPSHRGHLQAPGQVVYVTLLPDTLTEIDNNATPTARWGPLLATCQARANTFPGTAEQNTHRALPSQQPCMSSSTPMYTASPGSPADTSPGGGRHAVARNLDRDAEHRNAHHLLGDPCWRPVKVPCASILHGTTKSDAHRVLFPFQPHTG